MTRRPLSLLNLDCANGDKALNWMSFCSQSGCPTVGVVAMTILHINKFLNIFGCRFLGIWITTRIYFGQLPVSVDNLLNVALVCICPIHLSVDLNTIHLGLSASTGVNVNIHYILNMLHLYSNQFSNIHFRSGQALLMRESAEKSKLILKYPLFPKHLSLFLIT